MIAPLTTPFITHFYPYCSGSLQYSLAGHDSYPAATILYDFNEVSVVVLLNDTLTF